MTRQWGPCKRGQSWPSHRAIKLTRSDIIEHHGQADTRRWINGGVTLGQRGPTSNQHWFNGPVVHCLSGTRQKSARVDKLDQPLVQYWAGVSDLAQHWKLQSFWEIIRIGHGRCENCYSMSCRGCVMRIHNNATVMDAYYIIALHQKNSAWDFTTGKESKSTNLQSEYASLKLQ